MSNQRVFSSLVITWVALPSLAILPLANAAMAQNDSGDYILLIAFGLLCDPSDASTCPAVVRSSNGDSYEMSGAGTLNTKSKSATATGATGTFTHRSPNGNSLETGIWVASGLVSFDSYGVAPGALKQQGLPFGPLRFGPRPMPMLAGPMPAGGRAVLRIRLLPMWGPARTAILEVNCALGKVPDDHPTDGIRLAFERGGAEFDEEPSGRTLLTRTRASTAPKAPAPEADTTPAC